ncbi:MAG: 2-hydroxychromene-2-carboxylate isomerase [Rhodobacteraceae bacterium HLUCCA08]|nr:MAG: 2-hydroxychromene-2-carboxylate isomerase [Rhodobacteraceae bacterium HLUCCA08]
MPQIDYFFSLLSPYTYLAGTRPEAVAARHGATLVYKPVDIFAVFARTGGLPVRDRAPARQEMRLQELRRQAKKAGLPINLAPPYPAANAAPASYGFIAAQSAGGGDLGALVHALTRAVWAEDRDIAEEAVIKAALDEAGFDPGLADWAMVQGAETYAANTEEAVNRGVFGVPFWITETDERFWGQDRIDDLDAHLAGTL